jgi:8-oxo-(d)GTP phosphatase
MNSKEIRAAGAVLWRPGPEILLVHRPKYDDWSLPKGKQEPGEHILLTAVREVQEETSVRPVLGPKLHSTSYLAHGQPKRVDYWAARYRPAVGHDAAADNEIDSVAWLPLDQALERLSYRHDRDVIAGLVPRQTVPLILVRHASAGAKDDWPGDDSLRPLDARGASDSAALAGLLACFAPRARVLSSPMLRCTETVHPYADLAEVPLETDPSLSPYLGITNGGNTPGPLIRDLVAAGEPAIVCLHRENLPSVLAAACLALGSVAPADPLLPKGGFWVLHCVSGNGASGTLAAAEKYHP